MAHARAGSKQALWGLAVLREALMAGSFASVLSTFTLAWAGHSEVRSAVAPLNAVSHWRWGRPAFHQREFSVRHTLLGYSIHHCASIWWAAVHAAATMHHPRSQQPAQVVAGALTTCVVACFGGLQMHARTSQTRLRAPPLTPPVRWRISRIRRRSCPRSHAGTQRQDSLRNRLLCQSDSVCRPKPEVIARPVRCRRRPRRLRFVL